MTAATPSFQGVPEFMPDDRAHRKRLAQAINQLTQGKMNVTLNVTLNANTTTTIINDARIGYYSVITWMPITAHGATAAQNLYATSQKTGQTTLNHASSANTDQNLTICIIG